MHLIRLAVVLLVIFCAPCLSDAATYYVATTGNDSLDGLSLTTAWRNIQKAANTAVAGDVIRVQPGTYNERVTETTDGTQAQPITYLADGAVVIFGGVWLDGADYVSIAGFEVTQINAASAFPYEMFRIDNSRGVRVTDCYLHHADRETITFRGSSDLTLRGNRFSHSGWRSFPWVTPGTGNALVWAGGAASSNFLMEYNTLSEADDFINNNSPNSFNWVIRNNYFGPEDARTGSHLDNLQQNAVLSDYLMEANWDEGNDIGLLNSQGGHHMQHLETAGTRNLVRGNVTISSGGGLGWTNGDNNYAYHNTWHGNAAYSGNTGLIRAYSVYGPSIGNEIYNNLFSAATSGNNSPIGIESPSAGIADYNLTYQSGVIPYGTHNVTGNPQFVSIVEKNFSLQSTSPGRLTAGPIARASTSGASSTVLQVNNAGLFWVGDDISIGTEAQVAISAISLANNTLTLSSARSWAVNDPVRWRGQTDIGALPYKAQGYSYTVALTSPGSSAIAGSVQIVAEVSNPEVVRMVEFWVDGVPLAVDTSAPYAATWNANGLTGAHTIRARAYSLYASATLWMQTQSSVLFGTAGQVPGAPQGLQVTPG